MTNKYFYGNQISDYGTEHGYVDYRTLARCFDAVLNNDIMNKTADIGYWDIISGSDYDEEEDSYSDIYQMYRVSDNAVPILEEAGEIVYRNEELDLNVWGVTHYGTAWDYVLTDIKIEVNFRGKKRAYFCKDFERSHNEKNTE